MNIAHFMNNIKAGTEVLDKVDLSTNEHTNKQESAWKGRTRKGSNESFIAFRYVKSIEARRWTSDGLKSFESTWTNFENNTTHTLLLGNEGTIREGVNDKL